MEVQLPHSNGCFYVYQGSGDNNIRWISPDLKTMEYYSLIQDKLYLTNRNTRATGTYASDYCPNTHNCTCIEQGDLVYKPEYKEFWMPHMAIGAFLIIVIMIFKLLRGKS